MKKTQRQLILNILKNEGSLNSYKATYELGIKQAPSRIKELKNEGHRIISIRKRDRSVDWTLMSLAPGTRKYKYVVGDDGMARKVYADEPPKPKGPLFDSVNGL